MQFCFDLTVWYYQYQEATLTQILKIISQCDIKHMMMLPIKRITSVLMILTYTITSIVARPNGLSAILMIMIMCVSTFKTAVIPYTVEFIQSDNWVFRHPVTKIYGSKVFLLTKVKPEYSDILFNFTHFPGPLVCRIRQVPLYISYIFT